MTISTMVAKSRYAGDGSTTSFPTGFKFLANADVRVILRRTDGSENVWTEGSEYGLTGAGQPGGGTVEVSTGPVAHTPAAGETLVVKLAVPARQETSLPLGGAFPSTVVETMADLAVLRDQQIDEALSRAPKFKETTALANIAFPEPEAGKPLGWNGAGDALTNLEAIGRWQGDWQTATSYVALDFVREPLTKSIYACEVAHTSGTFATDLAAGKWSLAIDVEGAEEAATAAEAAQAAAESAQANAETAQATAEASASAAAIAETSAGSSATAAAGSAATASSAASAAQMAKSNAETAAASAQTARADALAAQVDAETAASAAAASATQAEDAKLIWRGGWNSATAYAANDAVAHDGASWICIQAHSDQEPPNASHWVVLAAKGDRGDQGDDGADGLGVPPGGATGQVLRKTSNADNDTEWGNFAAAAVPTQTQAENGNSTTEYSWTPQRVHQAAKDAVPFSLVVAASDETTAITSGTGKVTFRLPHAVTLAAARASLTTASSSGAVTVDINENGASILATKLTIDQGEKSSMTAATPAVLSDTNLVDDAEISIDVDDAGSGAAGLKVTLIGHKTAT